MSKLTYKATVTYEYSPISILDRNIKRIADQQAVLWSGHNGRQGVQQFAYLFGTNRLRQKFIRLMRAFVDNSDFGVRVRVKEVE